MTSGKLRLISTGSCCYDVASKQTTCTCTSSTVGYNSTSYNAIFSNMALALPNYVPFTRSSDLVSLEQDLECKEELHVNAVCSYEQATMLLCETESRKIAAFFWRQNSVTTTQLRVLRQPG